MACTDPTMQGKTLETPERVPFRLTQNMVDGFGITGVEGVFRIACEVTMALLRDNKDCLMSVLDAFIHDPLVEWEDEHRRMVSGCFTQRRRESTEILTPFVGSQARKVPKKGKNDRDNNVAPSVDLKQLAKNALLPIEKKLKGIYSIGKEKSEKEISTSSLVQVLIEESTSGANLVGQFRLEFRSTILTYAYRPKCIPDGLRGIELDYILRMIALMYSYLDRCCIISTIILPS